jgi:hypothetical protein
LDTLDASRRGPGVHCFTERRPNTIGAIVVLSAWQQINGRVGLQGNVLNLRKAEAAGNDEPERRGRVSRAAADGNDAKAQGRVFVPEKAVCVGPGPVVGMTAQSRNAVRSDCESIVALLGLEISRFKFGRLGSGRLEESRAPRTWAKTQLSKETENGQFHKRQWEPQSYRPDGFALPSIPHIIVIVAVLVLAPATPMMIDADVQLGGEIVRKPNQLPLSGSLTALCVVVAGCDIITEAARGSRTRESGTCHRC